MPRTTLYAYDLSGNIVQKVLANGLKEVRTHDGRNRVSTLVNQTSGASDVAGYAYQYDAVGNVMEVAEDYPGGSLANRTITNEYDGVYRLTQEEIATTGGSTVTTVYEYDKGHNRTSKTVDGTETTYVIGDGTNGAGANQIVSETTDITIRYEYDANGNRSARGLPLLDRVGDLTSGSKTVTGLATTESLEVGMEVSGTGIDPEALVTDVGISLNRSGTVASGVSQIIDLDLTGIVVGMAVNAGGITGGAVVTSLIPSLHGVNLSAPALTSGTISAVFTTGTITLSVAASATTSSTLTFYQRDLYTYDDENRLIEFDYVNGGDNAGTYAYAYDYRTRRVGRSEPTGGTTHIVFDGGTSILEYSADPSSPRVEYVRGHDYGGGVGGLEYSIRSGVPSFNFYDSRGDVTTQTDALGSVTFQTAYEAFGNQTVTDGTTQDRQKASTKEQDPTGLLNEGFRYRDPSTGTFITRDPLGFKAGPNMYTYVRQNPWTHFDPEGLDDNKQPNPPPPKKTTSQGPIGPGGWHKEVIVGPQANSNANNSAISPGAKLDVPELSLNMQSKDQKVAASARDLGISKGEGSRELNTEGAKSVLDISGGITPIAAETNAKIGLTFSSGELNLYTNPMTRGNGSFGILANLTKVGKALDKGLGPVGFVAGVMLDAQAVRQGTETKGEYYRNTAIGAGAAISPHVAVFTAGLSIGQLIQSMPSPGGGGRTIGENLSLGVQAAIAPSSVERR